MSLSITDKRAITSVYIFSRVVFIISKHLANNEIPLVSSLVRALFVHIEHKQVFSGIIP